MSTPADANVPLVHASFTCVEETANLLAKERAKQVWRAPRLWTAAIVGAAVDGFVFSRFGADPARGAAIFATTFVLLAILLAILQFRRVYRSGRRVFAANYPSGAVLRAEFGTHGFTTRSPRGMSHVEYGELKRLSIHTHSAVYMLAHQPGLSLVSPRELFPDAALDLIEPHVKALRRG